MYDNLVSVSTYARRKGVTTECVRLWCVNKNVESVLIDGKRFVVLTPEEMEEK